MGGQLSEVTWLKNPFVSLHSSLFPLPEASPTWSSTHQVSKTDWRRVIQQTLMRPSSISQPQGWCGGEPQLGAGSSEGRGDGGVQERKKGSGAWNVG